MDFVQCVQLVLSHELVGGADRLTIIVKIPFGKLCGLASGFDQPHHIFVTEAAVIVLIVGFYLNQPLKRIQIHVFHGLVTHDELQTIWRTVHRGSLELSMGSKSSR